jgi:hypothetical protein
MAWKPSAVVRFIRPYPSSAKTALVETDAGQGYLKAMGAPEGPHTLASEVVAIQLAHWLGLPTFEWSIIPVDDQVEIPFVDKDGNEVGKADRGPAFITKAEEGGTWSGRKADLERLDNQHDLTRLVIFDTWLLNCDRYRAFDNKGRPRVRENKDNVFMSSEEASEGRFRLKAMDHTHCFTCGGEWTRRLSHRDTIKDERVFGLFPIFRSFMDLTVARDTTNKLGGISRDFVGEVFQTVPPEWEVSGEVVQAATTLIVERAKFVSESIVDKIWPRNLPFPEAAGEWEAET